jgi:hypothetical protein
MTNMLTLWLALLLGATAEPEVRIDMLEGEPRAGQLLAWGGDTLTLQSEGAEVHEIDLDRVLRVEMADSDESDLTPDNTRLLLIQLVDGSHFSLLGVETTLSDAMLSFPAALFDAATRQKMPLADVHWVRKSLAADEPAETVRKLEQQWREILAMRPAGDLIVIRKPGADSLNYVEGAIGDVGPEKIGFSLDDQQIEVAREKVFGWIYYRGAPASDEASATVVADGASFRLKAEKVEWRDGKWELETPLLGPLSLAEGQLRTLDFSAGRVLYLSDLEPRSADWTPPATLPLVGSLLEGYVRDRGFFAPRLLLEYPPESLDPSEATSAGISRRVEFRKGLAIRGNSQLAYRLPTGFRQFRAVAGIDPHARATGSVDLRILGDGKELLREKIVGDEPPREIACSVEGVRQLELEVDYGPQRPLEMSGGGTLHLGHARLTK